ncbi:GTP-binding protein [Mycena crocata]|nr:GTP-binding protein [Mycena crocata]
MPRIRKKTSNRGSTNERKKILHKVRESRKKKVKAAKKNPQWKSKTKKDPGIPNNFPYKDQILAEIADQRRVAAEEKQRKKDEKKKKPKKTEEDNDVEDEAGSDNGNDNADEVFAEVKALGLAQGFDGIASLSAKRLDNTKLKAREVPVQVEEVEEEEEVPVLLQRDMANMKAVLDEADVIVEVLDARDPLPFRSTHVEELVAGKADQQILLVLNKIDTCPRESVAAWTSQLRAHHPTLPFRAASSFLPAGPELVIKEKGKGKAKAPSDDALGVESVLERLGEWAEQKKGDKPLCVAVVGFTNVGKSSFVNSLLQKSALPVYTLATSSRGPTTTLCPQEVTVEVKGKQIRLIDTPGISWASEDDGDTEAVETVRARDILMRSKGRIDRLKDPILAVSRANTEDLMLFYSLPAFSARDTDSFLSCVARANQLVKKKGELDLTGAARVVLRDWSVGRFPWYTVPPTSTATPSSADDAALVTLQTRKELRKARGLVKFTCGAVETRKASVEEPWTPPAPEKTVELAEDEDDDEEMDGEDEDKEEEDEDDPMEEEPEPVLSGKQKRKRATEKAPPPRKKVSFGPDPKISKEARSAGSLVRTTVAPLPAAAKEKPLKSAAPKKDRKVANTAIKGKSAQKAPPAAGAAEEYDFGMFF